MTAPALPGAAPDPARLPPEVDAAIRNAIDSAMHSQRIYDNPALGADEAVEANRARLVTESRLRTAIARALGGDGEPVAWQRGCKPVGNRAVVEVCHTSDIEPDDVIFHEGAWYVVLDSDESDATQVWAAPIVDDAGGQDEPEFCYGEFFVRCVPTRPAATGDTGEGVARG